MEWSGKITVEGTFEAGPERSEGSSCGYQGARTLLTEGLFSAKALGQEQAVFEKQGWR